MQVLRATDMGMCFGVRDALHIAAQIPDPTQVTIHGELVHNAQVNNRLTRAGFRQSPEDDRRSRPETPMVLITAHGISNTERRRLRAANTRMIDTTCPLVRRVHDAALELQAEGRHVLLIGKARHVEVQGIVEDLSSYQVIECAQQVERLTHLRLGIVCQTTMPTDLVAELCEQIRRKNPQADIRLMDTVCDPTKRRQQAMLDLIGQVDAVVVVGGRNSNNTRRLVQLCQRYRTPVVHVESAQDLQLDWFDNIDRVGLTAGTSTLDSTIDAVHQALESISLQRTQRQET